MTPAQKLEQEISQALSTTKAKKGTIHFRLRCQSLFDRAAPDGVILQAGSPGHVFRLAREDSSKVSYYYWSPGSGSRVATVDLNDTKASAEVFVGFNWQPRGTQLAIWPVGIPNANMLVAEGRSTHRSFRMSKFGTIVQLGDEGVDIVDMRMEVDGKPFLLPTAYENWKATVEASQILQRGKSEEGHMFNVVRDNSVITKLVTGFETYCKTRLVEMEYEGVAPNVRRLAQLFPASEDRESLVGASVAEAAKSGTSVLELWLIQERRINFQEFDKAKRAFNRAYGLKFGELGVSSPDLESLKMLFQHRHRVIHVSPLAILMPSNNPSLGADLLSAAPARFNSFIDALHEATLSLDVQDT